MTRIALVFLINLCVAGTTWAAEPGGYRKAYFGATTPGAWAKYAMKVEGQPDMETMNTRLPDAAGQQRVQVRLDYMAAGRLTSAFTDYALKPGYSLEADALGYGKALVAMSASTPGAAPTIMPPAVLESARKTMPDYAASAQFVGTENIGGKISGRYKYEQRHPGNPVQIETGEIWLNDTVPFGLVKQKAVTREASGKVVSQFETLLVDSGVNANAGAVLAMNTPPKGAANAAMALADAFKSGRVELAVAVVPGTGDGRSVRVGFKNKTETVLRLTIPAGATTLDVGTPLDKLRLVAAAGQSLDIAPGATSKAVDLAQTGTRRAIDGTFAVSVYEGTPLFSGSVTMGTVTK